MRSFAPLLRLRGIRRQFHDGNILTHAAKRVDLDLDYGEFIAITGPSGAGKSTILNIIGLLDTATAGTYEIAGHPVESLTSVQRDRLRSHVFGFVFQSSHLLPYESVAHNAGLGLAVQGSSRNTRDAAVSKALAQVGLLHRANAAARTLSGGERQRLAIARAIATDPLVILADEPTGNLDRENSAQVMAILHQLNEAGKTIVVITHDADVAAAATARVSVSDGTLRKGSVRGSTAIHSVVDLALADPARRSRGFVLSASERLSEALSGLTARPARSMALIAAFMLGAGGLVAATGLGASAAQQIENRLAASALDELYVFVPAETSTSRRDDWKDSIRSLPKVKDVAERVDLSADEARVTVLPPDSVPGQPTFTGRTIAISNDYLSLANAVLADQSPHRAVLDAGSAYLGATAASELGVERIGEGSVIWALGRQFTVVNILVSSGRDLPLDASVILPIEAFPNYSSTLVVRTEMGYPAAVADAIPFALSPGSPGSVNVSTVADLRKLRIGVSGDLDSLVALVSLVLLAIATLSAGTSMFLAVQSRSQEIALRRALGLGRGQTAFLFLAEGAVIGFAGGIAGIAVGMSVVVIVSIANGWTAVMPLTLIPIGLSAGFIAGVVSAAIPALAATKVEPAQAIR